MSNFNLVAFGTDSYKMSHWKMYPPGTEIVYSYCEPRVGARFDQTVFFGLQYILEEYLSGQVVTKEKIEEANRVCNEHFGDSNVFNYDGWYYILNKHGGYLPIKISAVPEGTVVPPGTALFTIENTDTNVPWLTNFLETLLMEAWSPITVASSSFAIKKIIKKYLEETGDVAGLPFKLHDFGYRGVSSRETAALAGAAHLVNFMGTDTMAALDLLRKYYDEPMAGFSIRATEHSIMTAEGPEGEARVMRRVLESTPPDKLVAAVGDSYDMLRFVNEILTRPDIKPLILKRTAPLIVRPDSGKIPDIDVSVSNALEKAFGFETNTKGYQVLNPCVRMIQGDAIKWERPIEINRAYESCDDEAVYLPWKHTVEDILSAFKRNKISADNIAFGSGGGLLQDFTRDTQRFAIKCSWMQINGESHNIFKAPATDPTKNSKRGRLVVTSKLKTLESVPYNSMTHSDNILRPVFLNGMMQNRQSFRDIRNRANEDIC